MIGVRLNGDERTVPAGASLADLVTELTVATHGVAVALDGAVVPRSEWGRTELQDGALVEVLTAVQGG